MAREVKCGNCSGLNWRQNTWINYPNTPRKYKVYCENCLHEAVGLTIAEAKRKYKELTNGI